MWRWLSERDHLAKQISEAERRTKRMLALYARGTDDDAAEVGEMLADLKRQRAALAERFRAAERRVADNDNAAARRDALYAYALGWADGLFQYQETPDGDLIKAFVARVVPQSNEFGTVPVEVQYGFNFPVAPAPSTLVGCPRPPSEASPQEIVAGKAGARTSLTSHELSLRQAPNRPGHACHTLARHLRPMSRVKTSPTPQ